METFETGHSVTRGFITRGEEMLQPDEVAAMMRLHGLGLGAKRLAREFGCARNTVRRYLRPGGSVPFRQPVRRLALDGLEGWLRERSSGTSATPTSSARNCLPNMGWCSAFATSSGGLQAGGAN